MLCRLYSSKYKVFQISNNIMASLDEETNCKTYLCDGNCKQMKDLAADFHFSLQTMTPPTSAMCVKRCFSISPAGML